MNTEMSIMSASSGCGLAVDVEYNQARSSLDSRLTMTSIVAIRLQEFMMQVQDGIGTVAMPENKQDVLDAVKTNLKQASKDMVQLYRESRKVFQVAQIVDRDRQKIMDQGRKVLWSQLVVMMESIKMKLSSISSEWQSRSDNTCISALRESLDKLLYSTVGKHVLQQTNLIALEEDIGYLAGTLSELQRDPEMIDLESQLATRRGELISTETHITGVKASLHSAKEDRKHYLKETNDRRKDEQAHSELTHDDHQQRLLVARADLERLITSCQSNVDGAGERKSQQLAALQNRRATVVEAIQKLAGKKQDLAFNLKTPQKEGWDFFEMKYYICTDDTIKMKALEQQMKDLNIEADRITAQMTADIDAIQGYRKAQADELQIVLQTAMKLLSPGEKEKTSLLAEQTKSSDTLLKIAEKAVNEAEMAIITCEGEKNNLTSSINDLESRIAAKKSINQALISVISARMTSAKDQHHNQLEMQNNALFKSDCVSLKSLICVIPRLQRLIRIQSDLMMGSMRLATPICEIFESFTYHWDEALKVRGNDERGFHHLTTREPPISTVISGDSMKFDPLIRVLRKAGADRGVDDALHLLETEDEKEKQELDDLLEDYGLEPKLLLLRTAKHNLKKELQRQAARAAHNSDAISDSLYQQLRSVYQSLDPFCALWNHESTESRSLITSCGSKLSEK